MSLLKTAGRILSVFVLTLQVNNVYATSLDELLQKVKVQQDSNRVQEKVRETQFTKDLAYWQKQLQGVKARLNKAEADSQQLGERFDNNEKHLSQLQGELDLAKENLGELFGVVRQVSGEFSGSIQGSVISAQFPERNRFIKELAESKLLPSLVELEKLWFVMQQDMTESAKLGRFSREIVDKQGLATNKQIIRVGAFNLLADKEYLVVDPGSEGIRPLSRPVLGNIQDTLDNWESDSETVQPFYFDPARGELLTLLSRTPSLMERVQQGGVIGYLILSLLLLGLIVAAVRYQVLAQEGRKIKKQLKMPQANKNNALGRLFAIYQTNKRQSSQLLELKLDEAVCRELPRFERGSSILKLLATIAPMMGLLGTVTGMIGTFQSITLFGTSDPKLMAGGISMALITTVMGLIAALPLLLIHSLLHSRANELVNIIEEQSAGLIALQAENEAKEHLSNKNLTAIENEAA